MSENNLRPSGHLKLFLGYAAGVGKTYRMLEEGQRLKEEGVDIVVGYFEPHGRKDTLLRAEGLELIPRRKIEYRGITFEEMDTDAIVARRPAICLVDELAHTNVPGSERAKRWEDVLILLEAGIDVFTTMNVQHLESLNDQVWQIAGIRVRETLPDWFVKQADEVVMVDATPGALLNRLKRGDVYEPEKARRAMENFFQESTLVALRELALRQTAHEVEVRHEDASIAAEGSPHAPDLQVSPVQDGDQKGERILIHVTADPSTAMLIRRGKRVADYLRADCFAVYVCRRPDLSQLPGAEREAVEKHLNFARNLHIETRVLQGEDAARAVVEFSRQNLITQIILARSNYQSRRHLVRRNLISGVVELAKDIRINIVAERRRPK
jgi:two-component system, OmpR family, sensor histidine kinase KdpD